MNTTLHNTVNGDQLTITIILTVALPRFRCHERHRQRKDNSTIFFSVHKWNNSRFQTHWYLSWGAQPGSKRPVWWVLPGISNTSCQSVGSGRQRPKQRNPQKSTRFCHAPRLQKGKKKKKRRSFWFLRILVEASFVSLCITVKVSNFGSHGNFGPFFASSVSFWMNDGPKINRTKFVDLKFFYNFYSLDFSVGRVLMIHDSKPFWKRGPKLEVLTVS